MPEQILDSVVEEELKRSYMDYAMSVIVGRAIPDVRDGLKPVQRRILYAMYDLGLLPGRPFRKSATVVGEVIGKYHPHGDSPVYEAMVRMAQDFSLRYPLVEGQGNFGSIDGDPPAAYRYTEARLSPIALEMLEGIEEETVDWIPNFDGRLQEPVVLPGKFPNLLCNGTTGIAVGMATSLPPHNLSEVVDALVALIENPNIEIGDLLQYIQGPDFPTAGILYKDEDFFTAYRTGRGRVVVEARAEFETPTGKNTRIVIREIPYMVNKTTIIERIVHLVRNKKIEGVADLRDESDREGIRLVVEVKRGHDPTILWNQLLLHTPLRVSFSMIFLVLVDGEPRTLNLKELLEQYLTHREDVVVRRTQFRLRKAEERAHILEGFLTILDDLDRAIIIIRASENRDEAARRLMEAFALSETQVKAVLEMRLHQLTRLERDKIQEEYRNLLSDIERFRAILSSHELRMQEIKKELLDLKARFGDARRTEIRAGTLRKDFDVTDLIPDEEVVLTLTRQGYIKRTPLKTYRSQSKGGVGKRGIQLHGDDWPVLIEIVRTHDNVLFLTQKGKAYILKVYEIPEGSPVSRGRLIANLIQLDGDIVRAAIPFRDIPEDLDLLFVTSQGLVKRTPLREFQNAHRGGINAIRLREGDQVITVLSVRDNDEVLLATRMGQGVRFDAAEVRPMGRNAQGVRGASLQPEDKVVDATPISPEDTLLVITERGYGKRTLTKGIRKIHRGGRGVRIHHITPKTGSVVRVFRVEDNDQVLILSQNGKSIRISVHEIRETGRVSQGVKLLRVDLEDRVVDAARIEG